MAAPPTVTLEYKGRIAIITIDNDKKLNALDADGYYQLASHMKEVAEHDEVYITVLTGKGTLPSHPHMSNQTNPQKPGRYFSA